MILILYPSTVVAFDLMHMAIRIAIFKEFSTCFVSCMLTEVRLYI